MIIISNKNDGKLSAYMMIGFEPQKIANNLNQINFIKIAEEKCTFLNDRFIRMMYVNSKD
jgi:hypothetical protein